MVTPDPAANPPPQDEPLSRSAPPPMQGLARLDPSDWSVPATASPIILADGTFASSVSLLARVDASEWQATMRRVLLSRNSEAGEIQDMPLALVVLGTPSGDYPLHVPVLVCESEGAPEARYFVPAQIWQSGRRPVRFLRDGVWHATSSSRSGIATRCPPGSPTLCTDPRTPGWVPVRIDVIGREAVSPPHSRRRIEAFPIWNPHELRTRRATQGSPPGQD